MDQPEAENTGHLVTVKKGKVFWRSEEEEREERGALEATDGQVSRKISQGKTTTRRQI